MKTLPVPLSSSLIPSSVQRRKGLLLGLAIPAFTLAALPETHADTLHVTTTADSGPGSLRQAIADASSEDTVSIGVEGEIILNSGLVIDKALTIAGHGAHVLSVKRGATAPEFSVFRITAPHVTLRHMTIANGRNMGGGAIDCNQGGLIVEACTFTGNTARRYGGGAVYLRDSGVFYLRGCIFEDNLGMGTDGGGGVTVEGGTASIDDCHFIGNESDSNGGGGLSVVRGGEVTITRSLFKDNVASLNEGGGGIMVEDGSVVLRESTLWGNKVTRPVQPGFSHYPSGGGLLIQEGGNAEIVNCTFSGNTSTSKGGAIQVNAGGSMRLLCSTVTLNGSESIAAGGLNSEGDSKIGSTILSGNVGASPIDISGTVSSLNYNLVGEEAGEVFARSRDQRGIMNPGLLPLGDYEGPTPTHPPTDRNLRVLGNGSASFPDVTIETDQNGAPRTRYLSYPSSGGTDVGAVELQDLLQLGDGYLTVNSPEDVDDGFPGADHCTLREAIIAANESDAINRIRFAAGLDTITLTKTLPVIKSTLTVEGPGANNLKIESPTPGIRLLVVDSLSSVTLQGLTFANGDSRNGSGGAIENKSPSLVLDSCEFVGNRSSQLGGAIYGGRSSGTTLTRCTFENNIASQGGAVASYGKLTVTNCTFKGNEASSTITGEGGGAIAGLVGSLATMTHSTFAGNRASHGGALLQKGSNRIVLASSLIGGNESTTGIGPDLYGSFTSQGYNFVTNPADSSGLDDTDTTGLLTGLANDLALGSGTTRTLALSVDSPALDMGKASTGVTTDQRGRLRTVNLHPAPDAADGTDPGAFELDLIQVGSVLVVNTLDDVNDGVAGIGHCSLREAITLANSRPNTTIQFAESILGPPGGSRVIQLAGNLPLISRAMEITGPGAPRLTLRAGNPAGGLRRVITAASSDVTTISGLTFTGGYVADGGAAYNDGRLTFEDCHFTGNWARGAGGAIVSTGKASLPPGGRHLILRGCTISGNEAATGGGCQIVGGTALFERCTFSGNKSSSNSAAIGVGGSSQVEVLACTISGFHAHSGSGIATSGGNARVQVSNSIIAGNANTQLLGMGFVSGGFNLIGGNTSSAAFNAFTDGVNDDQVGVTNPRLGPLADNGGPTPTMALLPGSRAIDQGKAFALTTDQRGFARTVDHPHIPSAKGRDGTDVGAFELGALNFDQWRRQYFTGEQYAGGAGAPEDDTNGGGLVNSLKFIFNVSPSGVLSEADRKALPQVARSAEDDREYLTITYRRNALIGGTPERVEWSEDLSHWEPAVEAARQIGTDPVTFDPIVEVKVDVTGKNGGYVRVTAP